jgi:hypothetical protein
MNLYLVSAVHGVILRCNADGGYHTTEFSGIWLLIHIASSGGIARDREIFQHACQEHDLCYSAVGTARDTCDSNFLHNMGAICAERGRFNLIEKTTSSTSAVALKQWL